MFLLGTVSLVWCTCRLQTILEPKFTEKQNWNIEKSVLIEQLYSIHLGQNFTGYERFVAYISFNKYTKLTDEVLGNTF